MLRYTQDVQDQYGNAMPGVPIFVTTESGAQATLYADDETTVITNPVRTDASGVFSFKVPNGKYVATTKDPRIKPDVKFPFSVFDPDDFSGLSKEELEANAGASLVGFSQAGTIVVRTVEDELRDRVSVKQFGAVGNGIANELQAFSDAYAATAAGGRIFVPIGSYAGVSGALAGTKFVIWETSGQPAGGGAWDLPGLVEQGFTSRKITLRQQTVPDDDGKVSFTRVANHSGGTPGFVNANISVNTTVGAANTNFEWGFLTVLNNNAATGENCALYAQGNKLAVGPTWAGVFEAADKTNTANPTSGLLGLEVDVFANGTDTNNNRIGIDLVVGQANRGGANVACEAYAGVRVNRRNLAGDVGDFNYGMVVNSGKVAGIALRQTGRMGIDMSEATFSDTVPNMAIRLAAGMRINFNAADPRTLRYETSTSALRYATAGATLLEIGDDGSLRAGGEIRILGTKVVGSRDTGWVAMTGTGNKNTVYDVSTVTLPQLAARVLAIQVALTNNHGLIGA